MPCIKSLDTATSTSYGRSSGAAAVPVGLVAVPSERHLGEIVDHGPLRPPTYGAAAGDRATEHVPRIRESQPTHG